VNGGNGLARNPICFNELGIEALKMYNPSSVIAKSKEPVDFSALKEPGMGIVISPTLRGLAGSEISNVLIVSLPFVITIKTI